MNPQALARPVASHTTRRAVFITPLLLALASLPALLPATGHAANATQGSGKLATENRSVAEFQAIALSDSMDLLVRQGPVQSVEVKADDNLIGQLETVVENTGNGATLKVRWKRASGSGWNWNWNTKTAVQVTVVVPKLTALSAAGSGDIRMETFSTPVLQVSLTGSGDAKLDQLTTDELGIRISGSGDVSAKGTATRLKVSIAGSGDVRLQDLRADEVSVSIAGSGDAAVNAQKTLTVSIAGSGDVTYTGNAAVKSSVAGSGSVNKK